MHDRAIVGLIIAHCACVEQVRASNFENPECAFDSPQLYISFVDRILCPMEKQSLNLRGKYLAR